jgi:GNAT superfamily N-acetyltransferase
MEIRAAVPSDADAICQVLIRSISELCVADHQNDPAILTAWLKNETTASVLAWIANPGTALLVATEDGRILSVGGVANNGTITLNYVSPDARFRGITKAMLTALEAPAAALGNSVCTLESTKTALQLYISASYVESCPPTSGFPRGRGIPMTKALNPAVDTPSPSP